MSQFVYREAVFLMVWTCLSPARREINPYLAEEKDHCLAMGGNEPLAFGQRLSARK